MLKFFGISIFLFPFICGRVDAFVTNSKIIAHNPITKYDVGNKFQSALCQSRDSNEDNQYTQMGKYINDNESLSNLKRRSLLVSIASATTATILTTSSFQAYADSDEMVESIAERAARIANEVEKESETATIEEPKPSSKSTAILDTRTAYDFSLPVQGEQVSFTDLIRQEYEPSTEEGVQGKAKVKAILVVNIKQDDVIARKNIAEFISLAAKYGPKGFAILCLPTDQGYYEPDTSALIRLKLRAEYGYGINPATALTDKVNLLGTGAHPFMRWIQGRCRTPSGLGKIQGNFEKFLVDGQTGLPLRRYPRKYDPYDMTNDIEALLKGMPLPPPGANFYEEWRTSAIDAERDTYRFQKGLNVFDQ